VEDTRELLDNIPYAPTKGQFKIYLIDEVHMLSGHSFNALLKTLEEPPAHVKFLLATTDPQKLPATVLSRCLQFHLTKMTTEQIEQQLTHILLSEKIAFEKNALSLIGESANGSMRDALSLLDQCIAYGNGEIKKTDIQSALGLSDHADITALLEAIHLSDANRTLLLTQQWASIGAHFGNALSEVLTQLYQLSVMQSLDKSPFPNISPALTKLAQMISREDVQLYYQIALTGQRDLPLAPTAQIGFEMIVLRMIAFKPTEKKSSAPEIKSSQKKDLESSSWNEILNELSLSGPALALAQHCALVEKHENELQFKLEPKYAALASARLQQRIQDAVNSYLGRSMKLTIKAESHQHETPAELMVKQNEEKKATAKKAIAADAAVQRIVKTFDATVIDN
jgi:DNA polymerase-3 subunit gamma/tau